MSHFEDPEFHCKCGRAECPAPKAPHRLLRLYLDRARDMLGQPIVIISGNRCPEHNKAEHGEDPSEHVWADGCLGADVLCENSRGRWLLMDALRHAGVTRLGFYHDPHLHIGVGDMVRADLFAPNVAWVK